MMKPFKELMDLVELMLNSLLTSSRNGPEPIGFKVRRYEPLGFTIAIRKSVLEDTNEFGMLCTK